MEWEVPLHHPTPLGLTVKAAMLLGGKRALYSPHKDRGGLERILLDSNAACNREHHSDQPNCPKGG